MRAKRHLRVPLWKLSRQRTNDGEIPNLNDKHARDTRRHAQNSPDWVGGRDEVAKQPHAHSRSPGIMINICVFTEKRK